MSLKAKLEAVIYAAEEPVTLAQLALLFAGEALAWKAERDADAAPGLEFAPSHEQIPGPELISGRPEEERLEPESTGSDGAGQDPPASTEEAPEAGDAELESRRQQRQREREVREILRGILDELVADYAGDSRGLEIREIAGGFRMGTKPELHDAVRAFIKSLKPPMKLSLPALETLAVIAYKQPVTAPEVGEIRGVDSAGVLGSLMGRKLIATAGRKQVVGRPMLYKTTKEFLLRFGLKDLNELPSMEEFEKMAALELSEESLDGDSLYGESSESAEPVETPGDLFSPAEATGGDLTKSGIGTTMTPHTSGDLTKSNVVRWTAEPGEPNAGPGATNDVVSETSIPTAESSEEAAEAHAIVERQTAEEIEVEQ